MTPESIVDDLVEVFEAQGCSVKVALTVDQAVAADPELYVDPPWVITVEPRRD